tara:strand:+ start:88 stop:2181 length:2094 start_codon:yes stop_codon:yes gene_type:complete
MKSFSQFIIEKKGDNPDIDLRLQRGRIERKQGRELNPKEVDRLRKGAGKGKIGSKETDFRSLSKSGAEKFNRGQQNVDKIIKGAEDTKNISGDLARRDATKAGVGSKSTPQQLKRQKGFLDRVFKNLEKGTDNLTKRLTGRFSRPATRKGQRQQEVRGRSGKPFSTIQKDIDAKNPTRTSSVTGGKLPAGDGRKNNKGSGSTWKKKGEWKTGANPSGKPEVSKPKAVKQSEVSKKATEYTKKYNTSQYKKPITPPYSRSQKSALTGKANKILDDLQGKSPSAKLSARMSKAVDSSTKPGTYSDKVNQALKYKKPTPAPKSTVIKPETFTNKSTGQTSLFPEKPKSGTKKQGFRPNNTPDPNIIKQPKNYNPDQGVLDLNKKVTSSSSKISTPKNTPKNLLKGVKDIINKGKSDIKTVQKNTTNIVNRAKKDSKKVQRTFSNLVQTDKKRSGYSRPEGFKSSSKSSVKPPKSYGQLPEPRKNFKQFKDSLEKSKDAAKIVTTQKSYIKNPVKGSRNISKGIMSAASKKAFEGQFKGALKNTTKVAGKTTFKTFAKKTLKTLNPVARAAGYAMDVGDAYKSERAKGASRARALTKGVVKAVAYPVGWALGTAGGSWTGPGAFVTGMAGAELASSAAGKTFDKIAGKTKLQKEQEKINKQKKKQTSTSGGGNFAGTGLLRKVPKKYQTSGINISADPKQK